MIDNTKHIFEAVGTVITAIATVATWFAGMLPPLAAAASIAWIGFQFYVSPTMVAWREKRKIERDRKRKLKRGF